MTTNLNKASGNNYRLNFPKLPIYNSLNSNMSLELNIFGTVMPGRSFTADDVYWAGFKQKMLHGEMEFNSWNVSFTIDEEWNNWATIFNWMNFIADNQDTVPGNKSLYSVDASLIIFNNFNTTYVKRISFSSIFPVDLGDVEMSERDGETYLEVNCQFAYDYYKIL